MFAGPKTDPAGRANWVVDVTLGITRPLTGQTVEIWGDGRRGDYNSRERPSVVDR